VHHEWLEVAVPPEQVELESWRLWEAGAVAVEERVMPGGAVLLVAGFADKASLDAGVAAVGGRAHVVGDDGGWRNTWKQFAQPYVVAGRVAVVPSWAVSGRSGDGLTTLVIDPGDAFGLEHATTKACLERLVEHVTPGCAVLDVGCGSGILAVAAAALGATRVVACDIDPVAVATTQDNARRNGVTVEVRAGSIDASVGRASTFDVVVANLGGAAVVVDLAPALLAAVAPGGVLIAGGLLGEHDRPARAALHAGARTARIDAIDSDPWRTFVVHVPR
jgi:ribosomal protein L11 methyltransferase